jgi:MPBQ/MSBQ methyltransferase
MRFIQHKREALWFYRFLSPLYDRWVNPLFWTAPMRDRALELARLDERGLRTVDVGAGTGFATEGIVARIDPVNVTLLDQSPDQLGRAARKPALADCERRLGDAERLPWDTDSLDRYVSCGSIEYWPDPQRALAEAYRVLRPGGRALVVGPLPPPGRVSRALAQAWMLFPSRAEYRGWMETAGFTGIEEDLLPPPWRPDGPGTYGVAIAGTKPAPGRSPASLPAAVEALEEPPTLARRARLAARFVAGSAAGAAFVPIGLVAHLRARRAVRSR